jgi:APA family basic amino acid/polyamine antiporter
MGRDDVFFRQLGHVHATYHTPAVAIVVQATMSAVLVIISALLVENVPAFAKKSIFDMMTDYVIFSASIFYALCVLAVFILRWKHPEWERPYRTWGYPAVPAVFLAVYGWFLVQVYSAKPAESKTGLWLILLGIPVYYAWRLWAAQNPQRVETD